MVSLGTRHVVPLLLVAAGCAVRPPATWRLAGAVLTPPDVANASVAQRTFTSQRAAAHGVCPRDEAVNVEAHKGRLKVTVNRAALEKQPKGWLADWAAQAETAQCVGSGQGEVLAERVLEAVPLATGTGFRLMHSDDIRAGFVDLGPNNRLQVISLTVRPGTSENAPGGDIASVTGTDRSLQVTMTGTPDVIGHETFWYAFQPRPGGGARLVEPRPAPLKSYFAFGPEIGFYRMFYKSDQTMVLVGARSRDRLPRDLDACGKPDGPVCITPPRRVGVNPYLTVMVNGAAITAPLAATVRNVIQAAKARPENVLPTLNITKPYAGKQVAVEFDRARQDVLSLVLTGNEEIRW